MTINHNHAELRRRISGIDALSHVARVPGVSYCITPAGIAGRCWAGPMTINYNHVEFRHRISGVDAPSRVPPNWFTFARLVT